MVELKKCTFVSRLPGESRHFLFLSVCKVVFSGTLYYKDTFFGKTFTVVTLI